MFFSPDDTHLTQEEKINFIYKELRKHQTERVINLVWKWAWRGIFFVGMLYLYLNPSSIFGLVQNMTGMGKGGSLPGLPMDLAGGTTINPETLKKALELYKKASEGSSKAPSTY